MPVYTPGTHQIKDGRILVMIMIRSGFRMHPVTRVVHMIQVMQMFIQTVTTQPTQQAIPTKGTLLHIVAS